MKPKFALVLFSVFAFLALTAMSEGKNELPNATTLISQARSLQVWAEGTPAVRMRGRIEVPGVNGAIAAGDYASDWVSPSKWREEIRFENYQRMRIRDVDGYWQKGTLDYQPYLIYQLTGLLDLKTVLTVRLKQSLGKVKSRQRDGIQQRCVDVNAGKRTDRVLCFDDKTGVLIAVEYPQGEAQNPPEISRIEYKDFRSVAGKLIPYERQALKGARTVALVRIVDVKELNPINPAEFIPPSNAELWPLCDDMREEDLTEYVPPDYPQASRSNLEMGRVILYGVVETNGTLSHLTVIKGATDHLNEAAMEGARRRRYTPAQCAGKPIRLEISTATEFWLRH